MGASSTTLPRELSSTGCSTASELAWLAAHARRIAPEQRRERRVLRHCAELLDLDPDHMERRGALMRGTVEVQSLYELEPGQAHEITLVLS